MKIFRRKASLLLIILLTLVSFSGCLVEIEYSPTRTAAPTNTPTILPSPTLTPSLTPTDRPTFSPTSTLTPTPAPVTWVVEKGDELMGIAFYYGIPLEELMAANPSVTPNWLSVGTVLEIPVTPTPLPTNTSTPTATSTPQTQTLTATPSGPLALSGEAACYPDPFAGLNCLALIKNLGDETVENPSLSFRLTSQDANFESELVVFAPLNLLPAGSVIPVLASFPAPMPENYALQVEIDYWLPTMPGDNRYAEAKITSSQIELADSELFAKVSGQLKIDSGDRELAAVWLLAVAYDQQGNPLGFRRWEAESPLLKTEKVPFETFVYSLGPAIHEIQLMAEARFQNP